MTLTELLELLRQHRSFDVTTYLAAKIQKLEQFFQDQGLDSCVIGISGGVDSATVLALLTKIPSIKRIVPLIMPIYGNGTTGQGDAARLAIEQCNTLGLKYKLIDLTAAYQGYIHSSHVLSNDHPSPWANGQLASIVRTPCNYYHAALLQDQGFKSIVVGTINRDEGAYIGFFGKASDAMVDLQPIADLHKSEVYQIAEALGVISQIIERKPRGDVWDGRIDEEMIGAPYWAVELYTLSRDYLSSTELKQKIDALSPAEEESLSKYITSIENLHKVNQHKYQVGMPSHFIDVMPRKVLNGW